MCSDRRRIDSQGQAFGGGPDSEPVGSAVMLVYSCQWDSLKPTISIA